MRRVPHNKPRSRSSVPTRYICSLQHLHLQSDSPSALSMYAKRETDDGHDLLVSGIDSPECLFQKDEAIGLTGFSSRSQENLERLQVALQGKCMEPQSEVVAQRVPVWIARNFACQSFDRIEHVVELILE